MSPLPLKVALLSHGHTDPIRDGRVCPEGIEVEHIPVSPPNMIYRRMVRDMEFDVAEMAISTFLCARSFSKPITAIPVFPNRGFFSAGFVCSIQSGIKEPKDLEGKRVGMRAFTVTNTTQARGMLATEYGVDVDKVTWVVTDDDHVAEYRPPANVEFETSGRSLEQLLVDGDIDAALGANASTPGARVLISAEQAAGVDAETYRRTGVWPIGHTVVIRDDTLLANPWIAEAWFWAFKEAKDQYLRSLSAGLAQREQDRQFVAAKQLVGDDPLPYGMQVNRAALEDAIELNLEQKVIPQRLRVDELFAPTTFELAG